MIEGPSEYNYYHDYRNIINFKWTIPNNLSYINEMISLYNMAHIFIYFWLWNLYWHQVKTEVNAFVIQTLKRKNANVNLSMKGLPVSVERTNKHVKPLAGWVKSILNVNIEILGWLYWSFLFKTSKHDSYWWLFYVTFRITSGSCLRQPVWWLVTSSKSTWRHNYNSWYPIENLDWS